MNNPLFDLTGKVALITGSTKGIGRAIAEEMARCGAKVVISSRKAEACEQVAGELEAAGFEAIAVPCHVGRKQDLQRLVDTTLQTWGRIDVLVCNAATNPVYGPTSEMTDEAWDKIMGTNVKGTFWLSNLVLPHMAERGDGVVIVLSSIAGLRGNLTIGTYGVSKAAEAALARNLAAEWGPRGIRVNAIAPGLVRTDFAKALVEDPERARRAAEKTPLRRIGEPIDIAGLAVFLAAPASAYITRPGDRRRWRRDRLLRAPRMSEPQLVEVLPAHRFDEARLAAYLRDRLPAMDEHLLVRQFQGGQSNPTFLLETAGRRYVLRKKPPGRILPRRTWSSASTG